MELRRHRPMTRQPTESSILLPNHCQGRGGDLVGFKEGCSRPLCDSSNADTGEVTTGASFETHVAVTVSTLQSPTCLAQLAPNSPFTSEGTDGHTESNPCPAP